MTMTIIGFDRTGEKSHWKTGFHHDEGCILGRFHYKPMHTHLRVGLMCFCFLGEREWEKCIVMQHPRHVINFIMHQCKWRTFGQFLMAWFFGESGKFAVLNFSLTFNVSTEPFLSMLDACRFRLTYWLITLT